MALRRVSTVPVTRQKQHDTHAQRDQEHLRDGFAQGGAALHLRHQIGQGNIDEAARSVPFVLPGSGKTLAYTFQINLPDNVSGLLDPTTTRYDGDFFTYKQSQQFRENVARIALELTFLSDSVPTRDLDKFLAQLQHISQRMGGSFSVPEMWINSKNPGTAANTLGQRLRGGL